MAITITLPTVGGESAFSGETKVVNALTALANKAVQQVSSTTDNAIVRYDGTTGNLQNSGVTIDDSNNVVGINSNIMKTSPTTPAPSTNQMAIYSKSDERVYRKGNIDTNEYGLAEDFKTQTNKPSIFLNGTNAYISVTDNDNLNFGTGTFSYIGEHIFSSGSVIRYILYKQQGLVGFQIKHHSTNKVVVYVSDGTNSITITSTNTLTDGRFHTIGFICGIDKESSKLFIDGIEDITATKTGLVPTLTKSNTANLNIGSFAGYYHKNETRLNRLFNYALTNSQVQRYCYDGITYEDVGGNNTELTSGNLSINKRYKVIDAGTGIVINGAVQTLGSEIIATSASVTWNSGKVIQIGCVLDLSPDSITNTAWYDKSGNGMIATYINALPQNLNNYKPRVQNYSADMRGANVASATTITPSGELFHVTGTTAIATINIPFTGFNGSIIIIPDGIFTWTTAGNIALAGTAVVSKALIMTYDATTSKWYPSY